MRIGHHALFISTDGQAMDFARTFPVLMSSSANPGKVLLVARLAGWV